MLRKSHTYDILNTNSHPQTSMKEYYTYAYLREDGTPYYVGKGTGRRAYQAHKGYITVPPKNRILILKNNLTEEQAFRHEIYMIGIFGRKDNKSGILWNRTNGGDGTSGAIMNDDFKEKCRQRTGDKNGFYGRKHTCEALEQMKNSLKGRTAWNKGKHLPEDSVSAHALYMREWRKKKQ